MTSSHITAADVPHQQELRKERDSVREIKYEQGRGKEIPTDRERERGGGGGETESWKTFHDEIRFCYF